MAAGSEDHQQVLELVISQLTSKSTLFKCSILSQQLQKFVHDDVRRRLPALLPLFVSCDGCGRDGCGKHHVPARNPYYDNYYSSSKPACTGKPTEWLCSTAGREAVSSTATARAVLETKGTISSDNADVLAAAGLVLTSELVITACKQQSPSVQVLVRGLLQHEEKNRLVDLRSFEDMPMLRQVFEETKRDCICGRQDHRADMLTPPYAHQLPDMLHVIANLQTCNMRLSQAFGDMLSYFAQDLANYHRASAHSRSHLATQPAPSANTATRAQWGTQVLVQVLKTCLMRHHIGHTERVVDALREYAGRLKAPDARTCTELLHAAVSSIKPRLYGVESRVAASLVLALQKLAGMSSVPLSAYVSLLRRSMADPATAVEVLKMPQAQRVTSADLAVFLTLAMRSDGAELIDGLLKLPAAASLSEEQILRLVKVAASKSYDSDDRGCGCSDCGKAWTAPDKYIHADAADRSVLKALQSLSRRLAAASVLELLRWAMAGRTPEHVSPLLGQQFIQDKLGDPDTLMSFVRTADSFGLSHRLVPALGKLPGFALLPPDTAFDLLSVLFGKQAVAGYSCGQHVSMVIDKLREPFEGLTGQQMGRLLELATANNHHYDAAALCTLPAAQQMKPGAIQQLCQQTLSAVDKDTSCNGYCHDMWAPYALLKALLALPGAKELSAPAVHSLLAAAIQGRHLPSLVLLAKQLNVTGQQLDMTQEQLVALLQDSIAQGNPDAVQLLSVTKIAVQHMSAQDVERVLLAACAPPLHTCTEQVFRRDKQGVPSWSADYRQEAPEMHTLIRRSYLTTPIARSRLNMAAMRSRLLQLPAVSTLSSDMLDVVLRECIKAGHADMARQLLALPVTQQLLGPEALLQQCLRCAEDDAQQYDNACQGEVAVLQALLQHPAAQQFDSLALQQLVDAFGSAFPVQRYGTEFHPLALVMRLPVVQGLDASALLALLTVCVRAHVPGDGIAAALAAPAAAQWSTRQVRGLLDVAVESGHVRAFAELQQHPAAPSVHDTQMQALAAVLSSTNNPEEVSACDAPWSTRVYLRELPDRQPPQHVQEQQQEEEQEEPLEFSYSEDDMGFSLFD